MSQFTFWNNPKFHHVKHPLIEHKLAILRDIHTTSKQFAELAEEIAMLETYEATKDLPLEEVLIDTPLEKAKCYMVSGRAVGIVPILRAGLGMVSGVQKLIPNAKVGHIGLYRNEETHQPVEYFCKLPKSIAKCDVFLIDPMLATGGSAVDAVKSLKKYGVKSISFICIIAAPEGVEAFAKEYPEIPLYVGCLDRELNENAYICPGLGDCGDRIFGTTDE